MSVRITPPGSGPVAPSDDLRPAVKRLAAFGPAAIAIVLGILMLAGLAVARASRDRVLHTYDVIGTLDRTLLALVDAETAVRGYRIMRDTAFLQPYVGAPARIQVGLAKLRTITGDNAAQQARLDTLVDLSARRLAILEGVVQRLRAADIRESEPLSASGRFVMDSIREVVSTMRRDELRLLAQRSEAENQRSEFLVLLVIIGSLVAAFLGLVVNRWLATYADAQAAMARELDVQNDALHAANTAKMSFLTTMSHELRTPLNAIDGYAELLAMGLRGPVTPEQATDIERIRRSGRHLLSLINDILNFAKLEAGQIELHMTRFPIDRVLAGVETLIAPQMEVKGIRYAYVACPDAMLMVRADEDKVRQVVLNLVGNALKFTDTGGEVTMTCTGDPHGARILVRDTGRGIPPEKLDVIFDPFVQVDRTAVMNGGLHGVGLGLAISRDLARQMGGDLTVESEPGRGSTFVFTIPGAASTPAQHPS